MDKPLHLHHFHSYFFVGIAGTGMSAIAQYLKGEGKTVSGSDRLFENQPEMLIQQQLREMDIACFPQDGSGIREGIDVVIVSTAVEERNIEYQQALQMGIPIMKRSELLAAISDSKKAIAIGGTSGKSTTAAMLFHVLQRCGIDVSLITGAGLIELQGKGLPGNAWNGRSEWLIIEADESDGSIVHYHPEIGVLLNIDRDHKDYEELHELFGAFRKNTKKQFIVNRDNPHSRQHSADRMFDFGVDEPAGVQGEEFKQEGFSVFFRVGDVHFSIPAIGKHNMENALAVLAVARMVNVPDQQVAGAIKSYKGIYRRTQKAGEKNGIIVIDDFAHNPPEVVAAIQACQVIGKRVLAWFQPHGFGPLRFMHAELSSSVSDILRPEDIFLVSDVYYAGGTVNKDIQSDIVSNAIAKNGKQAVYFPSKMETANYLKDNAKQGDVILLMGARDPELGDFAKKVLALL